MHTLEKKKSENVKKVLILGSGGLCIGQAGEFDYSGSQAIKALKEEGITTILINPNIATIQTSQGMADQIYFLPINPHFVEQVIKKEQPDGILLSFGGQTALNCGIALSDQGVFERYGVHVLGTNVETIKDTEDRQRFIDRLNEISVKTAKSKACTSVEEVLTAGKEIGYPVMLRVAFDLGGRGSGAAYHGQQLRDLATKAFSSVKQVLIEEYLWGWKEIEYEVVRDRADNCITVCNMENFDPMGIHTGESIVVAPSQTLTNSEYQKLREISIKTIRHLGIVGECNIQFALHPQSEDYRVIEVNARLSRSSALASKATGYPLAFVAAKLALGYNLLDVPNSITKITTACFEPALDYLVVKIPRWDLQKFKDVDQRISSEMKSVGEVMAIGRKFEEALQKALRMLGIGVPGLVPQTASFASFFSVWHSQDELERELRYPTDKRIFAIVEAIKQGMSIQRIYELSGIDPFFLYKLQYIVEMEKRIREEALTPELLLEAKKFGFSDEQIGLLTGQSPLAVRSLRKSHGIVPYVKQIDTLAGEFPAQTNYLYFTYNGTEHDIDPSKSLSQSLSSSAKKKSVLVLGSGAYRIGSSVEFDWCCVTAVQTVRKLGYTTLMLNCNPETVSTDYDICDKLYFEEITFERVLDLYEFENPEGVIVSMGGQTPNNLALKLHQAGIRLLGTSPESIDTAEDRHKFSKLLDQLHIDQPDWQEVSSVDGAKQFAQLVGYPVLIRPSYVLSGAAMNVVFNDPDLEKYLHQAGLVNPEYPIVVSKFVEDAKEIEIDAVANKGRLVRWAISEHVENAGVHSGDATMVLPAQKLYVETMRRIKTIAQQIAEALSITGPFNIQFLARDNHVKVIECNLRASRSFPFCSKVLKDNFIEIATLAMLGQDVGYLKPDAMLDYVGVKAPQFSFSRLKGTDPILGVEMASTGEVACFGEDAEEAFLKALLSTGFTLPQKGILISINGDTNRFRMLEVVQKLYELGFPLYATEHTKQFYDRHGIPAQLLYKVHEQKEPNILTFMVQRVVDLVISMPDKQDPSIKTDTAMIRRAAIDHSIPLLTDVQATKLFVKAIAEKTLQQLEIKAWNEY